MRMKQIEASETRKPAASLMDLNVGKLTAREAISIFAVTVATLAIASLGALLLWVALPPTNGYLALLALFGFALAIASGLFSFVVARLGIASWNNYEQRLAEWHDVAIEAYEFSSGQETTRTVRQWDLYADDFRDMLLIAVAIHSRVVAGEQTPWSVRRIEDGGIWLKTHRLGSVNKGESERVARVLEDSGLIIERAPRKAGKWAAGSFDEVVEKMATNWAYSNSYHRRFTDERAN